MARYNKTTTTNGAAAYTATGNKLVDLFGTIGASRNNLEGIRKTFKDAFTVSPLKATAILLYARDIRHNGAGERAVFRTLLKDLVQFSGEFSTKVLYLIPDIARFDDLKTFYGTNLASTAARVWADEINSGNVLAAKWAKREDKALQKALGVNEAGLRKILSALRAQHIVESKMTAGNWKAIDYSKLPSVAGARYAKAFMRNDETRYKAFIESKDTKVNASAVFPHDVYRTFRYGRQEAAASKLWENLPDLLEEGSVLPMCDVSGSMLDKASGEITCLDVSVSLGVYLAQRIKGPFQDTLLTFSENPTIVTLPKTNKLGDLFNFVERMNWGMNTDIKKAYEKVLQMAKNTNATQDQLPKYILIMSDMQFDSCASRGINPTIYADMKAKFAAAGYEIPNIIFWNLNARYGNSPITSRQEGVAIVGGFSPNIIKAVLSARSVSPVEIMEEAIAPFVEMLQK